jgi:hypothetical protein
MVGTLAKDSASKFECRALVSPRNRIRRKMFCSPMPTGLRSVMRKNGDQNNDRDRYSKQVKKN